MSARYFKRVPVNRNFPTTSEDLQAFGDQVRLVPVHYHYIRAAMHPGPQRHRRTNRPTFNLTEAISQQTEQQALNQFSVCLKPPLGFEEVIRNGLQLGILFSFENYLEFLDCTGRLSQSDKRRAINDRALPILEKPNLDPERWLRQTTAFEESYLDYRKPFRGTKSGLTFPTRQYLVIGLFAEAYAFLTPVGYRENHRNVNSDELTIIPNLAQPETAKATGVETAGPLGIRSG